MKKHYGAVAVIFIIILICLLLFKVDFRTVDSLMRPPKNEGENFEIQTAFESVAGDKYSFKSPLSGDYNSSFISVDLNGDGDNEVLVFYCYMNTLDSVRVNILDKVDDKWQSIADIESAHSDIHRVEFADTDNDGYKEIILGCSIYETELTNTLAVYKINKKDDSYSIKNVFTSSYTDFVVCDVNNDKKTDLLVFDKQNGNNLTGVRATFYNFGNNRAYNSGEYRVTPVISSISSVKYDTDTEKGVIRFYVDGFKADSTMTTDVFQWDSVDKSFTGEVLFDDITVSSTATRNINIACADINSDSVMEIPVEVVLPGRSADLKERTVDKTLTAIKWVQINKGELSTVNYELINTAKSYSIAFTDEWFGKFAVKNDNDTGLLTFYSAVQPEQNSPEGKDKKPKKKKEEGEQPPPEEAGFSYNEDDMLFSVFATSDSDNNLYELSGYRFIKSDNGYNYYCLIYNKGKQAGITKETVKNILIT